MNPAALPRRAAGTGAGPSRDAGTARPRRDADGMAVASFVLGLVGLLVLNALLGPMALCLAVLALRAWRCARPRSRRRRGAPPRSRRSRHGAAEG
ncbi:hypothetical protein AB0R11_28520, partial [Streptomyces fradiae]